MSSNLLKPDGNWTLQDIGAIKDQSIMVTWAKKIPDEFIDASKQNVLASKCKYCSARTIMWCSPQLKEDLLGEGSAEPAAQPDPSENFCDEELECLMSMEM